MTCSLSGNRHIRLFSGLNPRVFENRGAYVVGEISRGSYMSAHVLLNLLNELGKRDKMRVL